MKKINGLDTITLDKNITPPKFVDIGFNAIGALQEAQIIANYKWIAIVPYCVACRVPLTWIRDSDLVFECPQCGMKWKKANGWDKAKDKALNGKK